MNKTGNESTVT